MACRPPANRASPPTEPVSRTPNPPPAQDPDVSLETIEFVTAPQPTASVIVLHGLGADGNDFVPVAQMMDAGTGVRYLCQ